MAGKETVSRATRKYLHNHTPLIKSAPLSRLWQRAVYLKLDNGQPSGSFKDRGMGRLIEYYAKKGITKFISSSGGNAGLAAATMANLSGIACHVIVPKTTKETAIAKMKLQNADVTITGENWNDADVYARQLIESENATGVHNCFYVHPFDHPLLWQGHSTVVHEIQQDWFGGMCILHTHTLYTVD